MQIQPRYTSWLKLFSLNFNTCKVMIVFFKNWPENFKNTLITLQALRFKMNRLNQTCLSLKSIMLTDIFFPESISCWYCERSLMQAQQSAGLTAMRSTSGTGFPSITPENLITICPPRAREDNQQAFHLGT
jgi:hypothetical protein